MARSSFPLLSSHLDNKGAGAHGSLLFVFFFFFLLVFIVLPTSLLYDRKKAPHFNLLAFYDRMSLISLSIYPAAMICWPALA